MKKFYAVLLALFICGMFSVASAVEDTNGPELISFREQLPQAKLMRINYR